MSSINIGVGYADGDRGLDMLIGQLHKMLYIYNRSGDYVLQISVG